MQINAQKSARLNLRTTPDALQDLREAASASGQDLTAFVLGAATSRAREVLLERKILRLSLHDIQQLEDALLAPAEASPTLVELFAKNRQRAKTTGLSPHKTR